MKADKASERLKMLCGLVPESARSVADVGTDHGRLALLLACRQEIETVYATDLRPAPLAAAQKEIDAAQAVLDRAALAKVELRLGDGVVPLVGTPVDCVCIAGMGGAAIEGILAAGVQSGVLASGREGGDKHVSAQHLVLNPYGKASRVRAWLRDHDWVIERELEVFERGRLRDAILARRGCGESGAGDRAYAAQLSIPLRLALEVGLAAFREPSAARLTQVAKSRAHLEQVLQSVGDRPADRARLADEYSRIVELGARLSSPAF